MSGERRLSGGGTWRRLASAAMAIAGLLAPTLASGQAESDYIAYPKSLVGELGSARTDTRQLTLNRMPGLSPDYRLGAGDRLEVTIVGEDPLDREVAADGAITIPFLGSVHVGDLTAEEAEARIAAGLEERDLIKDPQVLVSVTDYASKRVYALGEIDRPGEYAVSFQVTLMDLIFIAGGIDFTAARYGYLHRRTGEAPPEWRPAYVHAQLADLAERPDVARPGTEVVQVDLQPLKTGGVLERNIVLRHGDLFYVPRRHIETVYVIGDVNRPGSFELPNAAQVTAAQAIAWAGGPTRTARMSEGILVRQEADGERREFPVDFAAVLRGAEPDVDVRPGDIIFVPGSTGKTVGQGLFNTIPNIALYLLLF